MPSPGEDIQVWTVVADDNGGIDPRIGWSEGQTRASVNNSARGMMAAHAKDRNLKNGSIVTTGSANAQQFLSGLTYTTIPAGLVVKLKVGPGLTNTASATLNMDGLGNTSVKTTDGLDIRGGEFVGDGYVDLLYNGTNWIFLYSREFFWNALTGGGGIIIGKQVFSTAGSAVYTPTLGMECCIIECIGGGGGGGGAFALGGNQVFLAAAGGGAGGRSLHIATAAEIGASQVVVVGAAGLAGGTNGGLGGNGSATSFGTLCIANGGTGGQGSSLFIPGTSPALPGLGGTAGTGNLAAGTGEPGGPGSYMNNLADAAGASGWGGSTALGGGGPSRVGIQAAANPGAAGTGFGSGGSGASTMNINAPPAPGGAGAPGIVIVTEFAGRGAPGRDGPQGIMGPPGPPGSGTGDVLVHGTPVAGQIAQWFDTGHIQGVDAAAVISGFGTGDIKSTFKATADAGWVMLDDRTIGNASSGATNRANADTQDLFTLLWNNVSNTFAAVLPSRGASAAADWTANKTIALPKVLGRVMMGAGSGAGIATTLGQTAGAATHAMTISEMPSHTHGVNDLGHAHSIPIGGDTGPTDVGAGGGPDLLVIGVQATDVRATGISIVPNGGGVAMSLQQPSVSVNFMCKL